jgi:hypothetical protein
LGAFLPPFAPSLFVAFAMSDHRRTAVAP